ncbi:MAG TPA: hypothetical protein VN108_09930, partial [Marmoricola sp.]|nr:hypothetical protein [Marmoricola sp.]
MAEPAGTTLNVRSLLTSGWVPALITALIAGITVHAAAGVSIADVARFDGYLAGWIVLPGTLAWRLIDRRKREATSLSED